MRQDLDQIAFLLGRAYSSYIGLLQRRLDEERLSGLLKPGMGMIARMREAGVVDVEDDARDARASRVRLTPRARGWPGRWSGCWGGGCRGRNATSSAGSSNA